MELKDRYFTILQATNEFHVTRQTISRWLKEGKLHGEKVGRETLISKKEVQQLQQERVHESLVNFLADYLARDSEYEKVKVLKIEKGELCFSAQRKDGNQEIIKIPINTIKLIKGDRTKGELDSLHWQVNRIPTFAKSKDAQTEEIGEEIKK